MKRAFSFTTGVIFFAVAACSGTATLSNAGAPQDAGTFDAGSVDGGSVDAGPHSADAGVVDAGPPVIDAGIIDAGTAVADAGIVDGGPRAAVIVDGGLYVGDQQVFLFGGDLHYFRVHDPSFDQATTWAMWDQTLDLMADAGLNTVTTYVPWDYHNTADGQWDFTGAKDLGHFIQDVCGRGFYMILKPGPLITAEWPGGFGTFGAVPLWWKQAHPEALIQTSSGSTWTYSPTGDMSQVQPTFLHPEYLAAVQDYYQHVLPIAQPYLGSCIIGLQVDNETNLYWGNRYGDVDYSSTAITFYQSWLQQKYVTISALNAICGTTYSAFTDVVAPSSSPSTHAENPAAADWYWAGEAYVSAYLTQLNQYLEADGFGTDNVLHFTNDSPFPIAYGVIQLQNVLLHDPATKAPFGVPSLDLYPKQVPTSGALQDQPFQSDYFTSFWEQHHSPGQPPANFAYAAELQGGYFSYPLIGAPDVQPEATDQLLARTVGHGLRGGSFYVIRGGVNADGSDYDYEAAISEDGGTTPRYGVIQTWGGFLQQYGVDLQNASEVRNSIAILDNALYAAPQGGIDDNMQLVHTLEQPALFGWLINAGLDPIVLDSQTVSADELQQYAVVFYQNPDYVDDATSELLAGYVQGGGLLVNFMWSGEYDSLFQSSAASQYLSTQIFPATQDGSWIWATNTARTGTFNEQLPNNAYSGELTSCWYESYWSDPTGSLEQWAWEETEPLGINGRIMGYVANDDLGQRVFLGTNVYSLYNRSDYYGLDAASLAANAQTAQWLARLGGQSPIVSIAPQELVWARQSPTRLYLFVVDDSGNGGAQTIQLLQPSALGIDASTMYDVEELLTQTDLGSSAGSSLVENGIAVTLTPYGTAVIGVTPVVSGG